MSERTEHRTPLLLWPFVALWRLVAVILGLVFLIVGVILSLTVIGSIIGVPLALLGFLLMMRAIF